MIALFLVSFHTGTKIFVQPCYTKVCANLVGGIYTVIRSKAEVTVNEMGNQYILLGPYNEQCVRTEVEVMEPDTDVLRKSIEAMKNQGIGVSSG